MDEVLIGVATDTGRRRKHNEDSWLVYKPDDQSVAGPKGLLCAIADGMGGAAAGEVASRLALASLRDYYVSSLPADGMVDTLRKAVQAAHRSVRDKASENPEYGGMGSTLTALILKNNTVFVGHVGDSRAYHVRKNRVIQLTQDHTVTAELLRRGELPPEEARNHPRQHVLTQAVGAAREPLVEFASRPIKPGDVLVLCTDGLHNYISDDELRNIVFSKRHPQRVAEHLVNLANERGGRDNITVIVIKTRRRGLRLLSLQGLLLTAVFISVAIILFGWLRSCF